MPGKRGPSLFLVLFLGACAHAPPPQLTFALLGDTPYSAGEVERLDRLIDDLNGERLDFVVHLGDIGTSRLACNDAWLDARKAQFARIGHPVVMVPGDNEWTDCPAPQARLAAWRVRFCAAPFPVEVQPGDYCEHRRWQAAGLLFVTLNVPGSNNNLREPEESERRMRAVLSWLDDSAALAAKRSLTLVVLMQADPFVVRPRDGYASLRARMKQLGEERPGKVVLAHGDTHLWQENDPWPGVHRLEVWGSPFVSWVRADAAHGEVRFGAPRYR
jgi:hypothetical protein